MEVCIGGGLEGVVDTVVSQHLHGFSGYLVFGFVGSHSDSSSYLLCHRRLVFGFPKTVSEISEL